MDNKCTVALCFIYNPIIKEKVLEYFSSFCTEVKQTNNMIEIGLNKNYDVDINNMIRKTIFDLLGKEEEIKKYLKQNKIEEFLEIVPEIASKSNESKPILSLDEDIIEFLYKSGIRMDLDYYIY